MRSRLGALTVDGRSALLAVACLATPTLELIARATHTDADDIVPIIEDAENKGIIQIDGRGVNFTHPLLSRGVYTDAPPSRRREMHRRLASVVDEPELKARHLALAAASGDDLTLRALDAAAEMARIRGAPDAAAELIELAIGLGGDTPERSIRSAAHHYDAGDPARARSLLVGTIDRAHPGAQRAEAMLLLAAIQMYDDSFLEAAVMLERALDESPDDPAFRVRTSVMLAYALFNSGQLEPGLRRVDEAVAIASRFDQPALLGQALGMRATLRFVVGEGRDEDDMRRALEFANYPLNLPLAARPAMQNALLLAWTGQLDDAAGEMAVIRERCVERGEESELIFLGFHSAILQVWRGNLAEAELVADDTMELALQLDGDLPLFIALTIKSMNGAYAGRVDEVRRDAVDALAAAERCGSRRLSEWPITSLAFLEVSLGNYEAALGTLAPLLTILELMPRSTEIIAASYVPDAAEAMIALDRLDELSQSSMSLRAMAVGSTVRGCWRRVRAAAPCCWRPVATSMRPPMRGNARWRNTNVCRCRSSWRVHSCWLVSFSVGKSIGRRRRPHCGRRWRRSRTWVRRCGRTGLAQSSKRASGVRTRAELTASEQQVAELAATGATNKEMAAALFISPKTVEANLSRIYRKLGIRSRAELGRIMGAADK